MIGQSVGSDASPLSCFLFRPRKRLEKRRKRSHTNVSNASVIRTSWVSQTPPQTPPPTSINGYHTVKNGLGAIVYKWPTFTFVHESGYTLAFAQRIAHNGTHAETGAFRTGPLSLSPERSARSPTSPGRVSERQVLPLLGLGRGCSQRTQKAFGTAMRLCASLFRGVAAPLGCVFFSFLSKLRLVRPVPETSFGFPDAPACAVPVQAASQFVPFRLGAGQGFSVETGRIFCYNF